MKLLDEIIDLASGEQASVSTILRKCLVLAHTLKNDKLKAWAENELNGYSTDDEAAVPEYRKTSAAAKGLFVGSFGSQINSQPIPPAALRPEHKRFAQSLILFQPIKSYEGVDHDSRFVVEWSANLTAVYQTSFFQGDFILNRAWQEIPASVIVGLVDTIKTRILRFALELKDDLGEVHDQIDDIPKEQVDRSVINNIYGGTNIIGSSDFTQIGSIEIGKGDWPALSEALKTLGVPNAEVSELQTALAQDSADTTKPGLGERAKAWLTKVGKDSGQALLGVGVEAVKTEAKKYLFQYLGLLPS